MKEEIIHKYNYKKVIKEILIVVFTLNFVYFAFNNNYVRPVLNDKNYNNIDNKNNLLNKEESGYWHINKREHSIVWGLSGHTYLELVDNNSEIVGQVHGFAYNTNTGEIVERAMQSGYKLKVFVFDYNYYLLKGDNKEDNKNGSGVNIYSGTESSSTELWVKAKNCAASIDTQDYEYPKYGFRVDGSTINSNSVSHTIIKCMGLADINIGLITPGRYTDLIKVTQ